MFSEICVKVGADYQNVFNAIIQRSNINEKYLKCDKNYKGYNGHCLPKDTMAWYYFTKNLGIDINLFQSIFYNKL